MILNMLKYPLDQGKLKIDSYCQLLAVTDQWTGCYFQYCIIRLMYIYIVIVSYIPSISTNPLSAKFQNVLLLSSPQQGRLKRPQTENTL